MGNESRLLTTDIDMMCENKAFAPSAQNDLPDYAVASRWWYYFFKACWDAYNCCQI